jgi:Rrf2 family transcriptional regulator, iron-sulfur cluster assembly transcription factor
MTLREVGFMDLTLSKKGDYVIRAALALARAWNDGGYRKIREVAKEMDLPLSYTPQILGALAQAGIAEARAGRDGGYRLVRPPEAISLLDVVEAGEGPLSPSICALRGGPCRWEKVCALHPVWSAATHAICLVLQQSTLAGVVLVDDALEAGRFTIPGDAHRAARIRSMDAEVARTGPSKGGNGRGPVLSAHAVGE